MSTICRQAARDRLYKEQERLEALLKDAEANIAALEKAGQGGVALTPHQVAETAQFREQANTIRRQLRGGRTRIPARHRYAREQPQARQRLAAADLRRGAGHRRLHLARPQPPQACTGTSARRRASRTGDSP